MSDPAHKATDKEIERLEKKIKREYAKALDELEDKASAHFARFEEQDNRKRGELEMGYISKSEYYAWRQSQMAAGKRYETLIKDMTETLVNADKIAAGMIGERIPEVYAINSNYAAYEICEGTGANISFDLYDRNTAERLIDDPIFYPRVDIEKDERWNEKKVRSALLQGILQGDSVLKIANRLQQVTNMDDAAAVRNARTFCTRAQNAGRNDRYKEVEEKYGLHFEKEWISTDDERTRDTHKDKSEGGVGGEVVGLDEEFSNKLQYPGDPAGAPSEVYNCRCTMRSIYRGKKKDAQEEFGKFDEKTTFAEYVEENKRPAFETFEGKANIETEHIGRLVIDGEVLKEGYDVEYSKTYKGDGKATAEFFAAFSNNQTLINEMDDKEKSAFKKMWSTGKFMQGQQYKGFENMKPKEQEATRVFDKYLDRATLEKGVSVVRLSDAQLVLGAGHTKATLEELREMQGQKITCGANMSFSAASEGLRIMPVGPAPTVEYSLKVPGGTKGAGMYIGDDRINKWGDKQREFMTNRDIWMTVGNTEYNAEKNIFEVEIEYGGRLEHEYK